VRVLREPAAGFLVALLCQRRLDARQQGVTVPQRGRLGVAPLLLDEEAAGAGEVRVLVERERRPVEGVTGPGGVGVATREVRVKAGCAAVVAAVERAPRRLPQRIGRVLVVRSEEHTSELQS